MKTPPKVIQYFILSNFGGAFHFCGRAFFSIVRIVTVRTVRIVGNFSIHFLIQRIHNLYTAFASDIVRAFRLLYCPVSSIADFGSGIHTDPRCI